MTVSERTVYLTAVLASISQSNKYFMALPVCFGNFVTVVTSSHERDRIMRVMHLVITAENALSVVILLLMQLLGKSFNN